jgi:ATP-dependent Lhr-like helicase
VYWLNAADPASLAGIKVPELRKNFPPRVKSNFLVFHGAALKLELRRLGCELLVHTPPNDPALGRCLMIFRALAGRDFEPPEIKVETINGERAAESPYAEALLAFGFKPRYKFLALGKEWE